MTMLPSSASSRNNTMLSLPLEYIAGFGVKQTLKDLPLLLSSATSGVSAMVVSTGTVSVVAVASASVPDVPEDNFSSTPARSAAQFSSKLLSFWVALTISESMSDDCRRTFKTSSSIARFSARISSKVVSKTCAKFTKEVKPNAPAPPLIEWTALKILLIVSISP